MIIHVLGTAQDGGYPHAGCKEDCCVNVWDEPSLHRLPTSIAVVDQKNKKFYLFDVTPNIKEQLHLLDHYNCELAGIFITHAHIGHYAGLFDLGLEIMNTDNVPVHVMPRMKQFYLIIYQLFHLRCLIETNYLKPLVLDYSHQINLLSTYLILMIGMIGMLI